MRGGRINDRRRELGKSLLEMIVSLAVLSLLLMVMAIVVRQLMINSDDLKGRVAVLESMAEMEDFLRKEFQQLQFVPYCAGLLPAYADMTIGDGMDEVYRDYLQESVRILKPRAGAQEVALDLAALRGSGSATYRPLARKTLSGIILGSEILQVSGLLPTSLYISGSRIVGELTSDLVGVRNLVFYITDCRESLVLKAKREGSAFEMAAEDYYMIGRMLDQSQLHVYVVREYLIYTQLQGDISSLVIDFMDGQAFLRIPDIVDLRFDLLNKGVLSIGVLVAQLSLRSQSHQVFKYETYSREVKNARSLGYRKILIGLEQ